MVHSMNSNSSASFMKTTFSHLTLNLSSGRECMYGELREEIYDMYSFGILQPI